MHLFVGKRTSSAFDLLHRIKNMESIFDKFHASFIHNVVQDVELYQRTPSNSKRSITLIFADRRMSVAPSDARITIKNIFELGTADFFELRSLYLFNQLTFALSYREHQDLFIISDGDKCN